MTANKSIAVISIKKYGYFASLLSQFTLYLFLFRRFVPGSRRRFVSSF